MEQLLLGIDVGTTSTKALLISSEGGILAQAQEGYPLRSPGLARSEQDARDWWRAVVKTVREVCRGQDSSCIRAISLSTQGGTLVPVDEACNPLRPAIVWNDRRCAEEARQFAALLGADYMYQKSGWKLGNGLNALQIAWLRKHEPEVFAAAQYFLSVPDYLSMKLTGQAALDISNVGINQLADIKTRKYDSDILAFSGISQERLAAILPSGSPIGYLTRPAAEELGLSTNTILIAGAHDQYAALLGAGITRAGEVLIGTGTAWVATCLAGAPAFETGFSQSVSAIPDKWGSLVSLSFGGVCKDWLKKNILSMGKSQNALSFEEIDRHTAGRSAAANGLMFFPYFGEGSYPLKALSSKGSILGLDLSHDAFDLALAVMEGVSFHMAWILEHLGKRFPLSRVSLSGGAAKSALWPQITADILGLPIHLPDMPELSALGAAILSGLGSGVYKNAEEACSVFASIQGRMVVPQNTKTGMYAEAFQTFKARARKLGSLYDLIPAPE